MPKPLDVPGKQKQMGEYVSLCMLDVEGSARQAAGSNYLPTARQLWSWLNVMKLSVGVAMVIARRGV